MADARVKDVYSVLADIHSRGTFFAIDRVNQQTNRGQGDVIEIPSISALTVTASGATTTAPQAVTTGVLTLTVNLDPMINALMPRLSKHQLLSGEWARQLGPQAMIMLKNSMDESYLRDYLAEDIAWTTGTAATYHDNVAGDTLTSIDWLNCKAALLTQGGCYEQNLIAIISPFAEASIRSIAAFVPNYEQAEAGNLGISRMGTVHGVPVFVSQSIRRNKSVATSAASITSNVVTWTVGAGHGFVAGMPVTSTGMTVNATSATTITSTTSTTIVAPLTGSDGAMADGVGTVTDASSWNLMLDVTKNHVAQQAGEFVRIVPDFQTTGEALQLSTAWGRVSRAGYCRVLHSPGSSA